MLKKLLKIILAVIGLLILLVVLVITLAPVILVEDPQLPTPGILALHNPSPEFGDIFAYSVAAYGDDVLVGAVGDKTGASSAGAAYLFDGATGELQWSVYNPTPEKFDYFGRALAVIGDRVAISGYRDNTGAESAGSVYLVDGTSGAIVRAIHHPAPNPNAYFGRSLAVDGQRLVVGADGDSVGAPAGGAVYVFDSTTGDLLLTLYNPTPEANDQFGLAVAVSGNVIAVGAIGDNGGAPRAGATYLFDKITGELRATLLNPQPVEDGQFGYAVAAEGNQVLVGAPGNHSGAPASGAVYVFDSTTGALLTQVYDPFPVRRNQFGYAVVGYHGDLLVGAIGVDAGAGDAGAVYLFDGDSGELLRTLSNPTPKFLDSFGWSLATLGQRVVVGAIGDKTGSISAGSAYVLDDSFIAQNGGAGR